MMYIQTVKILMIGLQKEQFSEVALMLYLQLIQIIETECTKITKPILQWHKDLFLVEQLLFSTGNIWRQLGLFLIVSCICLCKKSTIIIWSNFCYQTLSN